MCGFRPEKCETFYVEDYRYGPNFCEHLWINFKRSCLVSDTECQAAGDIGIDTMRRYRKLQAANPDLLVDLTVLSSQDNTTLFAGGASFLSERQVNDLACLALSTRGGVYTVAAVDWFHMVAPLWILGKDASTFVS
ncbi:TPA: hypothetical protein N0F65_007001 [Lagenidium giganteum]|uniref:Uncharacterized protein n=1 Tax=Lagenidium giganteum TaxID=4803 RepID=A0AAV2ZKK2_9STRA|nr:TPA: hypothetical protein N0F65_007001 [Lagenidium giganteum]